MSTPTFRRGLGWWVLLWLAGAVLASLLDQRLIALAAQYHPGSRMREVLTLCKSFGSFPLWCVLGVVYILYDRKLAGGLSQKVAERGLALITATFVAGILAETLKLIVRRERPDAQTLAYSFRPYLQETFYGGGLGFPSSHTAVAFAGFFVLMRLSPVLTPLWWILATGTALQRFVTLAHYPSDVYVGATVGYIGMLASWWLHRRYGTGSLLRDHAP